MPNTTITARMTTRKGPSTALPQLLPGEFGLATDIQRLFIGQDLVEGAFVAADSNALTPTNTKAAVEFTSGTGVAIDFDEVADVTHLVYGISVYDSVAATTTEIAGSQITFVDSKATFLHGLSRALVAADTFTIWYNKEVGYHAEAFPNPIQTVAFAKSAAYLTPEIVPSVEFVVANKKSVIIDYTLSVGTATRNGTLSILLNADATNSSIKDEYDTTGDVPVTFTLVGNTVDKFTLYFDTTNLTDTHTFKYTQKSFK